MKRRQRGGIREGEEKEVNFPPRRDSFFWPLLNFLFVELSTTNKNLIDLCREAIMFSPKQTHSHKSAVLTELKLSLTSAAGSMEGFQWLLIYDGLNVG